MDAIFPTLQAAASSNDVSLDSIKITTGGTGSVITTISGSGPLDIPFSATLTEVLGIAAIPNADPPQGVPIVLSSSHSSSSGSLLDWLAGVFVPFLGLLLAAARGYLSSKVGGISKQVNGVALDGAGFISGDQEYLAGSAGQTYGYTLANLAPDSHKFNWQASGTPAETGSVGLAPFAQEVASEQFSATSHSQARGIPVHPNGEWHLRDRSEKDVECFNLQGSEGEGTEESDSTEITPRNLVSIARSRASPSIASSWFVAASNSNHAIWRPTSSTSNSQPYADWPTRSPTQACLVPSGLLWGRQPSSGD